MPPRKSAPPQIPPSLPPERTHAALRRQLESLQALKGQDYRQAEHEEQEWEQFTRSIVERGFGDPSSALGNFFSARSAGEHMMIPYGAGVPHGLNQSNYNKRLLAYEAFLKSAMSELELLMPEREIQGHYDVGDEYEFYRDIKAILALATTGLLVIDPYLNDEVFSLYADGINRSIRLRILSNDIPATTLVVAGKYAAGGNLSLRATNAIHDRLILIDNRVWFIGQSLKDAARKKPTYIVEQDAGNVRPTYEDIWNGAKVIH